MRSGARGLSDRLRERFLHSNVPTVLELVAWRLSRWIRVLGAACLNSVPSLPPFGDLAAIGWLVGLNSVPPLPPSRI
jgi:hypothetical protein